MSAAVAAALTFNLICSGTMIDSHAASDGAPARHNETKYTSILVLDLERGLYCENHLLGGERPTGCNSVERIKSVSPYEIVLADVEDGTAKWEEALDRTSGTWTKLILSPGNSTALTAQCEKQPFTGFPTAKF